MRTSFHSPASLTQFALNGTSSRVEYENLPSMETVFRKSPLPDDTERTHLLAAMGEGERLLRVSQLRLPPDPESRLRGLATRAR